MKRATFPEDPLLDISRFPTLTPRELKELNTNHLHRRWLGHFLRLRLFLETFERFPAQTEEYPKGHKIGSWAHKQRQDCRKDKMDAWRVELLESIGFDWGKKREDWYDIYKRADKLQREKGEPLSRYAGGEEKLLKQWLYLQAEKLRRGELDEDKGKLLHEAGLLVDRAEYHWNKLYQEVKAFIEKHERLPSAHSTDRHEHTLGDWRLYQVSRRKQGLLSKSQEKRMNALGLSERIVDITWEENFRKASRIIQIKVKRKEFMGKNGIAEALGEDLYVWWRGNRAKYRKGLLSREQAEKMEGVGMQFRVVELMMMMRRRGEDS